VDRRASGASDGVEGAVAREGVESAVAREGVESAVAREGVESAVAREGVESGVKRARAKRQGCEGSVGERSAGVGEGGSGKR
jgi:hypothetical protein